MKWRNLSKSRNLRVIKFAVFIASFAFILFRHDLLNKSLFEKSIKLNAVQSVYFADNGFFVIDNGDNGFKRLIRLDESGKRLHEMKGGSRDSSSVYNFYKMVTDEAGNIYVNNVVYSADDGETEISEIQVYSPDFKYLRTIVRNVYDSFMRKKIAEEYIYSSAMIPSMEISKEVSGEYLFYYHFDEHNMLSLYKTDLMGSEKKKIASLRIEYPINSICGTVPGKIFYSNSRGDIIRINEKMDPEILEIDASLGVVYPYSLSYDEDYGLLFNELYSQRLIAVKDGKTNILFDFKELYKSGYAGNTLMTNYFYSKGRILTTDKYRGNLLEIVKATGDIRDIYEASYFAYEKILKVSYIFALAVFVILSFYFFKKYVLPVFSGKMPPIVRRAVVFAVLFFICNFISFIYIHHYLQKQINYEREQKFLFLAKAASRIIDADLVLDIKSPKDISSDSFQKLSDQMKKVIGFEESELNLELTVYVYKKLKNVYCVIDANAYDFLFPYSMNNGYHQTLDEGTVKINKYVDENGKWLTATAPLRGKNGEISSLVEISQPIEIVEESDNDIKIFLFRTSLIFTGVFALSVIIVFYSVYLFRKKFTKNYSGK
ncbi:MAG: hypothetical protein KAZ87_12505 [Spirochaetes bacterium]|nr:hypothetical protein [Spirochaetota bacterium]